MYEEAYSDYLRDRGRGNGTLMAFHSAVSNFTSLTLHFLLVTYEPGFL